MTLRLFYASFCNIFKVYFTAAFILFYFILFYMCERLYVGCNGITGEVSFACDVSVAWYLFLMFFYFRSSTGSLILLACYLFLTFLPRT